MNKFYKFFYSILFLVAFYGARSAPNCGQVTAFSSVITNNGNGTSTYTFFVSVISTSGGDKSVEISISCPNNTFVSNACRSSIATTTMYSFGPFTVLTCSGPIQLAWLGKTNATCGGTSCETGNITLPVDFTMIRAKNQESKVMIDWTTASETNNDFFTIERSGDGRNFETIGEINGAGNSSHEITYTFTDAHPVPGINYYRIKQTDYDGQFSYSEIRSVRHKGLSNVSVTPRTTEDRLYITTELDDYSITIYNVAGQQVKRMVDMSQDQNISIETLNAGVYFIKINSRTESETVKVVKI
jgi:Secretion system C-terminal sorting domain